jgi:hypothetical protein
MSRLPTIKDCPECGLGKQDAKGGLGFPAFWTCADSVGADSTTEKEGGF